MLQDYYAFNEIAKNPVAHATPLDPSRAPNFTIYNAHHVDLYSKLRSIEASLKTRPDGTVSLASVAFPVNQVFNSLLDEHVSPLGNFFIQASVILTFDPLTFLRSLDG